MYINDIIEVIENMEQNLDVSASKRTADLRELGMDSIAFIQFLALLEEKYNIEFDYDFMDKYEKISIEVLDQMIMEKKSNET